uniref:Uncharacterized protein n=1 Tax=Anopheles christyi TaxID=43041 RepID=A0A182K029_9DIPT
MIAVIKMQFLSVSLREVELHERFSLKQPLKMYLKLVCMLASTLYLAECNSELPEVSTRTISSSAENTERGFLSPVISLNIDGRLSATIRATEFEPYPDLAFLEISPGVKELQLNAFASLQKLTHLSLNNNLIRFLPKAPFTGLHKLTTLSISNNWLESLGNGDEFLSLEHLESLSLGGNFIKQVHPQTFAHLGELKLLNLSWNWLTSLDDVILPTENELQVLDLSYNSVKLLNSSTFHTLQALSELSLAGNLLEKLHPSTFASLRNLTRLDLSDNFFPSLPSRAFNSNQKLAELNLEGNLLNTLPGDLFAGLKHLKVLNLRNNRLTELPASIFRDQPLFTQLALEGNRIDRFQPTLLKSSDVLLQNNRLAGLRKPSAVNETLVRCLFLYGNEIASIEQDVFEALPKLETLYLDYNRIGELSPMLFHTNHQLEHVTLSHNRLAVLRTNTFAGLARLHSVDLSYNGLVAIEPSVFHGSPVEYLNLNGNALQTLDDWTLSGTNLRYLHVDSNALGTLQQSTGGVSVLDGLLELSVANNRIARWQEFCTRNFSRLSALNLAYNSLAALEDDGCLSRDGNSAPVTINVAFNGVSLVPKFAGHIRLLDLSGNSVDELGDGHRFAGYKQTEVLLLQNTSLRRLNSENFAFLPHLIELAEIDLSHNTLQTVEESWFQALTHLKSVNIEGNLISQLPPNLFSPVTHSLEMLSIAGNALHSISDAVFLASVPIKALNLSNNHLNDVAILDQNDLITHLDVSSNHLKQLLLRPNYRVLLANTNQITKLEWDSDHQYLKFCNLQQLHLADNLLEQLDQRLFQLPTLTELDVSENRLDTFPFHQLHHLKQLIMLNVSRNNIRTLPVLGVPKFKLVRLDLSENPLDQVPERFLSSCIVNDLIVNVA